jgi:hypothetical protein
LEKLGLKDQIFQKYLQKNPSQKAKVILKLAQKEYNDLDIKRD